MKLLLPGLVMLALLGCSGIELQLPGSAPLTKAEVTQALKDALSRGIIRGVAVASRKNGFYGDPELRIELPDDVATMEKTLRKLGLGAQVDRAVLQLNRAAEEAASRAKPVFIKAITRMTVFDAFGILNGEQDAATRYLEVNTRAELSRQFQPVVAAALDETGATRYYGDIVERYNALPLVWDVDPDLTAYVTGKTIDGLFRLMAQEEARIRTNPAARGTFLLQRVFGSLD